MEGGILYLQVGRVAILKLGTEHLKKLLHNVKTFVQNSDAFSYFEVAVNAVIERLKLFLFPKKFRSIENVRV